MEPRRPGRPANGRPSQATTPRSVRLSVELDDALCLLALRHGISVHALLKLGARMVLTVDDTVLISSSQKRPA